MEKSIEVFEKEIKIKKARKTIAYIVLYTVLIAFAIIEMFPFLYMILASMRSKMEMIKFRTEFYLFPKDFDLWGYKQLFSFNPNQFDFLAGLKNTLIFESAFFFVGIWVDVIVAYGFAKINCRYRNKIMLFCITCSFLPFVVTLMPHYTMWSYLGLTGTMWPLVIPHFFGGWGVIFYLERYMKGLSTDIFEAGAIDGLSHMGRVFYLALPMSMPAIVVQSVFTFLGIWNEILGPDLYLRSIQDQTLQVMLQSLTNAVQQNRASDQPIIMAGATLSSLPILALYLSCQHLFVNSMAATAVKG